MNRMAEYIHQPMITYLGNKRKLVGWIMEIVTSLHPQRILDGFAGSGVVSRAFRTICSELHSNDKEHYSYILLRCFLETPTAEQQVRIEQHVVHMEEWEQEGFVTRLYAPLDTNAPQANERCFYTHENAVKIDSMLAYIVSIEEDIRHYLLGPLLVKASIHVNTAGVFRGFYKKDGVGHFGGAGENALERILAPIQWSMPIWCDHPCRVHCYESDLLTLVTGFPNDSLDLIYLDPPYNEHPYGSNYFMLNLIAKNEEPLTYSRVSGIPTEWNKSAFNGRGKALDAMLELLRVCLVKAQYILISYNNEGLITAEQWTDLVIKLGCQMKQYEKDYDTYHGSRNLAARNKKVIERMYLLSR